jgi:hypothetical protein
LVSNSFLAAILQCIPSFCSWREIVATSIGNWHTSKSEIYNKTLTFLNNTFLNTLINK